MAGRGGAWGRRTGARRLTFARALRRGGRERDADVMQFSTPGSTWASARRNLRANSNVISGCTVGTAGTAVHVAPRRVDRPHHRLMPRRAASSRSRARLCFRRMGRSQLRDVLEPFPAGAAR
ncbi:hypothetical protein FGB62_94g039 [Gracilaria domingensis]|nr:hypothetical protein FGB62_94g039 [Gracilaria domingensis]